MASTQPSTKSLERRLNAIRKEEALVNKWINLLTLSLALLYWVLDGRRLDSTSTTKNPRIGSSKVSPSSMGWIGGG
jgi:hypothetical protein